MIREILVYASSFIGLFLVLFYVLSFFIRNEKKHFKMDLRRVSIIIPAYNEEKTIERTIESALSLEYPRDKIEIIVVNDGSKDSTYKKSLAYRKHGVIVLDKKNGGKASAINLGLKKATGEFILTMDADTFTTPLALKKMVVKFENPDVMSVTPGMLVKNVHGFLQRVQQMEYLIGIFLRKAFSSVNAIHITPGAFSMYRKSFFDKYGGFQEGNITEDLEIALRIQSNNYIIENEPSATVYTIAPEKFMPLLIQRRRWYAGLMKNLWDYKHLFSRKYGDLGIIVLPAAAVTIFFTMLLTTYMVVQYIIDIIKEIIKLKSVNLDFIYLIDFNRYVLDRFTILVLSNPMTILGIIFILAFLLHVIYGKFKTSYKEKVKLGSALFIAFYGIFFTFWWAISIVFVLLGKKIEWRKKEKV